MTPEIEQPINIQYDQDQLASLCRKWMIERFALFGSVVRSDFSSDSDVDVLVDFAPLAPWSFWEISTLRSELEVLFGRPVDLVEKSAMRNPYRRREILAEQKVIYDASGK